MKKYCLFVLFVLSSIFAYSQSERDTILSSEISDIQITSKHIYDNGAITLSRKQFLTMAGSLEDPTRLLIKTPGISTANDQANSVIYHGMPAQYHQWSLYGARILNPNHNSNAGTISDLPSSTAGGVNMMSGQVIGSLEFNGNPSAESLGSLAGMSNIRLRNPYKSGLTTNLSLVGLEAGYDAMIGNDNLMVNYRYSTVGVLTGLGLDFGGEEINYQDLTSKYSLKRKSGDYSFYFSAGANSTRKEDFDTLVTEFKDLQKSDFEAKILIGGINHSYANSNYETNNTFNISRRIVDKNAVADIPITSATEYQNRGTLLALNHNYTRKFNTWHLGYQLESWVDHQFLKKLFPTDINGLSIERIIDKTSLTIQPTVNMGIEIAPNLKFSSTIGVSTQLSGTSQLELIGHSALDYTKDGLNLNIAFSRSAQNQQIELALDSFTVDNHKSTNLQVGIRYKGLGITAYHHQLNFSVNRNGGYNFLAVSNYDNLPIVYDNSNLSLVDNASINGVSLYIDREVGGVRIIGNLSLQQSNATFNNGPGAEYDLPLDYGHILNFILQKEWNIGTKKAIGLSGSIHHRGGERQYKVDAENSFDWGYTNYDYSQGPILQLSEYIRTDIRIYYKPSKRATISLDIQNVSNRENDAYYYYEPLTGESTLKKQLGMIPILSWRVDW